MISATGTMQPLPIRPIDGPAIGSTAPRPMLPRTGGTMRPLPVPSPGGPDLATALRAAAFQRLARHEGMNQPLPVIDRS